MSALAETPPKVAAPVAAETPVIKTPVPNGGLPSNVKINRDYSADEHFSKHEEANGRKAPVAPVVPVVPVVPKAADAPVAPPVVPVVKKADLASAVVESIAPESQKPPVVAPVAAAPLEDDDVDKLTLDPKYSGSAHEQFKAVKASRKEIREKLAGAERELVTTRAEVERLKTSGGPAVETPETVKMKTEHAAMAKRLMILDLESTPDFQREFAVPISGAEQEARNILEANGVTGVDIAALLSKEGVEFRKELSAVVTKLPNALDQGDFAAAIRTAQGLKQRANFAKSKAGEINQHLREQMVNGHKAAFEEAFIETMGAVKIAEITPPAGSAPEVVQEFENFNQSVRGLRGNAERIVLGASKPKDIAMAGIKAARFDFVAKHVVPSLQKAVAFRDARITELESELAGIRARNPNKNLGGGGGGGGGEGGDPSKMSHKDAAEHFYNKPSQ